MQVTVRYYAGARAATGLDQETVDTAAGVTVGALALALADRHGARLGQVLAAASFLLDEVSAVREQPVPAGAVLDVLPPFAGG
jgi:sulfur-carrier protein